jgi:hypothetical protein
LLLKDGVIKRVWAGQFWNDAPTPSLSTTPNSSPVILFKPMAIPIPAGPAPTTMTSTLFIFRSLFSLYVCVGDSQIPVKAKLVNGHLQLVKLNANDYHLRKS